MSFDPFRHLNALDDLVRQQEWMRRELEGQYAPLIDAARRAEEMARPLLEAGRAAEEMMRPLLDAAKFEGLGQRLGASFDISAPALALMAGHATLADRLTPAISPDVVESLTGQFDAARPLLEALERAIPRLPKFEVHPALHEAGDRLFGMTIAPQLAAALEPPAGLAALMRASAGVESSFNMPALQEAQRVAESFAAAMPRLSGLDSEHFGAVFGERFARRAETISADEAAADDALVDLADDVEEAFATAKTEEDRVLTRVFVLQQLIALAIQFGPAVAQKLWPLITVLLLTIPVPPLSAPPPQNLPAALSALSPGDALTIPGGWQIEGLPDIIRRAGPQAERNTLEFFNETIRSANTRQAYENAVMRFMNWCDDRNLELTEITPFVVTAYVKEMQSEYAAATVKQHLAAIRMLFDHFVVGQVLPINPASSVRGPKGISKRGKTPVLQPDEARLLLDSIDASELSGLRDRALLGVMVYSFARVSSVVAMDVRDYFQEGKQWWLRLHGKAGKHHAVPIHQAAEEYLDAYIHAAGIGEEQDSPLWRSMMKERIFSDRRMSRVDVFRMVRRRVRDAQLSAAVNCHTLRATGITAYLLNGGTLGGAQAIAAHESLRTTEFYGRPSHEITISDIEKIRI